MNIINEALAEGLQGPGNPGNLPVTPFAGTASGDLIASMEFIVNGLLVVAAIVAAIYLVMGGIRYITSQGEEGETEKAKNTILYAMIGLIVIGLSAALVNFVLSVIV